MSTNEPMTQERLNEIQGRLDASTWTPEEPWHTWKTWGGYGPNYVARYEDDEIVNVTGDLPSKEDSRLIAKAPTDLADLLAEVERLRAGGSMTKYMISWKSRTPGGVVTEPIEAANLDKLPIELLQKFEPRIGKRWRKQPYCEVAEAHDRNDCGFFFVQGKRTYTGTWWEVEA